MTTGNLIFQIEYLEKNSEISVDRAQSSITDGTFLKKVYQSVGLTRQDNPQVNSEWMMTCSWIELRDDEDIRVMFMWAKSEQLQVIRIRLKVERIPEFNKVYRKVTNDVWNDLEARDKHHLVAMRLLTGSRDQKPLQF